MKYCPGCATALDDNIRKCPQCGHVFADVKPEFESSQRSENANARITSTQPEQPPIYSVPPIVNQNTDNNSTQPQTTPTWKKFLPLIILVGGVVLILQCCMLGLMSISNQSDKEFTTEEETKITTVKTYDVLLNVVCEENLLFNRYDINVLIDDQLVGKIEHGTERSFNIDLTDGKHVIKFNQDGSESVNGSKEFDVKDANIIICEIRCKSTNVEIKKLESSVVSSKSFNSSNRQQRKGFDSSTNKITKLSNYNCEIPSYWIEDEFENDSGATVQGYVVSKDTSTSIAQLMCCVMDDPNNKVFNATMEKKLLLARFYMREGGKNLSILKQEIISFGDASGIFTIFYYEYVVDGVTYKIREAVFMFASVEEEKNIQIILYESDNTEYSYLEDYTSILKSIKKDQESSSSNYNETSVSSTETTKPTSAPTSTLTPTPSPSPSPSPTPTPTSAPKNTNRYAFKSVASDYSVYYIIDMKEKKVYYFTTYDMKPSIGTIKKGDLKKGITVEYPNDGGTEVISYYKNNTDKIVVKIDGYDFILDSCDLSEAESKLPG